MAIFNRIAEKPKMTDWTGAKPIPRITQPEDDPGLKSVGFTSAGRSHGDEADDDTIRLMLRLPKRPGSLGLNRRESEIVIGVSRRPGHCNESSMKIYLQ